MRRVSSQLEVGESGIGALNRDPESNCRAAVCSAKSGCLGWTAARRVVRALQFGERRNGTRNERLRRNRMCGRGRLRRKQRVCADKAGAQRASHVRIGRARLSRQLGSCNTLDATCAVANDLKVGEQRLIRRSRTEHHHVVTHERTSVQQHAEHSQQAGPLAHGIRDAHRAAVWPWASCGCNGYFSTKPERLCRKRCALQMQSPVRAALHGSTVSCQFATAAVPTVPARDNRELGGLARCQLVRGCPRNCRRSRLLNKPLGDPGKASIPSPRARRPTAGLSPHDSRSGCIGGGRTMMLISRGAFALQARSFAPRISSRTV